MSSWSLREAGDLGAENLHRCSDTPLLDLVPQLPPAMPARLQCASPMMQACCRVTSTPLTGAKGKGAFMNGQPISVSKCKDVGMSLLVRFILITTHIARLALTVLQTQC